jgi:hypothetical protein
MKELWIIVALLFINVSLIWATQEPPHLTEVKRRYQVLLEHIRDGDVPEKFRILENRVVITGRKGGNLGYNIDKGFEIGICLDGTPNDMFHVLLHELSHSTVSEYSHSEEFWKNFAELKDVCVRLGIYEKISGRRAFCGKYIQD